MARLPAIRVLLMAKLGTHNEYEAWVCESDTGQPIVMLPWSSLKWQRCRNRISTAEVEVAADEHGRACPGVMEHLRAWSRLLVIERDGGEVFRGPIVSWGRADIASDKPGDITIRALDKFAVTQKRMVGATRVGIESAGAHFYQLLVDAKVGDPAFDPYELNVPAAVPYLTAFSREYRTERFERVSDCIDELARSTNVFFTCVVDDVYADEQEIRNQLGVGTTFDSLDRAVTAKGRPVLNERTTFAPPGIEVDGTDQITVAYVGGSNEGQSGAPLIGSSTFWDAVYTYGLLESGRLSQRAKSQDDVDAEALIYATESATPAVTLEKVRLTAEFGSDNLAADLSNLLPGCWVDIDYHDTSAYDIPIVEVRYEYRTVVVDAVSYEGSALTPVTADAITVARIEQIDVEVNDEGEEFFYLSLTPTAEWDGTVPTGWRDPGAGED